MKISSGKSLLLKFVVFSCFGLLFMTFGCDKKPPITSATVQVKVDSLAFQKTDSLYARAKQLFGEKKFEEAQVIFDTVCTKFKDQQRYSEYFYAIRNRAVNQRSQFLPDDRVVKELKTGMTQVPKAPDTIFSRYLVYLELGLSYVRLGAFQDAKYYANKSYEVLSNPVHANHSDLQLALYESYDLSGVVEKQLFNFNAAEEFSLKSLDLNIPEESHTNTLAKLTALYLDTKQYEKAKVLIDTVSWDRRLQQVSFYEKFVLESSKLDYYIRLGNTREALQQADAMKIMIAQSNYGAHFTDWYLDQRIYDLHFQNKNYSKVIEIIEAIEIDTDKSAIDSRQVARDLYKLAQAYFYNGNVTQAKKALTQAINIHLPLEHQVSNFFQKISLEYAANKTELIAKVIFKAEMATALFEKTGKSVYLNTGIESYELAHTLLKNAGKLSEEDRFLEDALFKEFYEGYLESMFRAYQLAPNEETYFQAFTAIDEAKNIAVMSELLEVKEHRIFQNVPQEIRDQSSKITYAIDSLNLRMRVFGDREDGLKFRAKLLEEKALNEFELKQKYPAYYQLLYGTSFTVEQMLTSDLANYNVIEYFVGERHIYIFNDNAERRYFDKVPLTETLTNSLKWLSKAIRTPGDKTYVDARKVVYEALLKEYLVEDKKTAVVPDGVLQNIPFEVLIPTDSFVDFSSSFVRINSVLSYAKNEHSVTAKAAAFAPFARNATNKGEQLRNSEAEVKFVKKSFGGKSLIDSEATKKQFLDDAKEYSIIHLATHSALNRSNPLRSAIYFTEKKATQPSDYTLQLDELYNLNMDAALVTLSACETGLGKEVKGSGIQSISNAFKYAGVGSTVMSLWKVPDQETAVLMKLFYTNLKNGMDKDVALQKAKQKYLSQTADPELRHPYYWAGFVISGDASPIVYESMNYWYLIMGVVLIGAFFVGYYSYRKRRVAIKEN